MEEGSFTVIPTAKSNDYVLHLDLPQCRTVASFFYHSLILPCIRDTERRNGIVVDMSKLLRIMCSPSTIEVIKVSKKPSKLRCDNCGKERTSKALWCSTECKNVLSEYKKLNKTLHDLYESKEGLLFRKEDRKYYLCGIKDPKGNLRKLTSTEKRIYSRYTLDTAYNTACYDSVCEDVEIYDDSASEGMIYF